MPSKQQFPCVLISFFFHLRLSKAQPGDELDHLVINLYLTIAICLPIALFVYISSSWKIKLQKSLVFSTRYNRKENVGCNPNRKGTLDDYVAFTDVIDATDGWHLSAFLQIQSRTCPLFLILNCAEEKVMDCCQTDSKSITKSGLTDKEKNEYFDQPPRFQQGPQHSNNKISLHMNPKLHNNHCSYIVTQRTEKHQFHNIQGKVHIQSNVPLTASL